MAEIDVQDAPQRQQFEARAGEELLGRAEYERRGDVIVLTHTAVESAAEGQGVGSALARTALDAIRAEGKRVDPQCPFIAKWIERNPDYADLVSEDAGS